jgi:hypothetical protein
MGPFAAAALISKWEASLPKIRSIVMVRVFASSLVALLACAAPLMAADVRGKLKGVDVAKSTITLDVDGKDRVFPINKGAELTVQDIGGYQPKDGLKDPVFQRKGLLVVLKVEQKDNKEVVTAITVYTGRKG